VIAGASQVILPSYLNTTLVFTGSEKSSSALKDKKVTVRIDTQQTRVWAREVGGEDPHFTPLKACFCNHIYIYTEFY